MESTKQFKAVAALAENRVIGAGNRIPWHLPEDLQWFKELTMGQIVVFGRKTFETIGHPLPGRTTIVLSGTVPPMPGLRIVRSLEEIEPARETQDVFICGGAEVYAQALPLCADLYLTHVKRHVEGDKHFPSFEAQFEAVEDILDRPEFRIVHYRRRARAACKPGA